MVFPYIRQIKVNDCYAYQNFTIIDEMPDKIKHIILTGKNGSGKTTILNRIALLHQESKFRGNIQQFTKSLKWQIERQPKHPNVNQWQMLWKNLYDVELEFFDVKKQVIRPEEAYNFFRDYKDNYIFSFFQANRKVDLGDVKTVTKETDILDQLNKSPNTESFSRQFKQYLVNKKVYEAFDYMDSDIDSVNQNRIFFDELKEILRTVFKDKDLKLEFIKEHFEFYLKMGDGRRITFNQLSEGFSAFINILMDLLVKTDIIRKQIYDFKLNPRGIVLIDEPETHCHIEMQYELLPLLAQLFPNIQFIIATHSPAIISSLKNAVVYDLTSKQEVSNWITSSSFSELMITHFGLENEFSSIADKIIEDFKKAYAEKDNETMVDLLEEHKDYLTPSLRLEIETRITELKGK